MMKGRKEGISRPTCGSAHKQGVVCPLRVIIMCAAQGCLLRTYYALRANQSPLQDH
jgi:hypothetical protein